MVKVNPQHSSRPNRLIHEKSPYLLQHAYNPVDWYPWGDEAFAAARRENKPIFLSIGYSTCHWCHVMEKESFANETIAEILNSSFISIKVDREERPDIDQIYMLTTQAITGSGGWPMSVFLFPDQKPFYAGTYFPPESRHNQPGLPDLLQAITTAWSENKTSLAESADRITTFLKNTTTTAGHHELTVKWSADCFAAIQESYDHSYCGFGNGNKFPRPASLFFLHHYWHRTGNAAALSMTTDTLLAMAAGGIYDHIGGGFHRYSVDRQWRVPHFEKMLYDQAQLCITYLQMYQETGDPAFAATAEETLDYVLRDLQDPDGGIYSAEDADSINPYDQREHGEGAFYLWKKNEIDEVLGKEEAHPFTVCYGVTDGGNALQDPGAEFGGRNILYMPRTIKNSATLLHVSSEELLQSLHASKKKLLLRRDDRIRPHLDDKIITAWNGLMLSALAKGGHVLENPRYLVEARRVADFILAALFTTGELKRRWREGESRFDAVLEDYAFLIQGLFDLYSVCHEIRYLEKAIELSERQIELFQDPAGGFFGSRSSAGLLTRVKENYDGAEPSGNSVSALNFLRLGRVLNRREWLDTAEKTITSFGGVLEKNPSAMPLLVTALELSLTPQQMLVIAGRRGAPDTVALFNAAGRHFAPGLQIIFADGEDNQKFLASSLEVLKEIQPVEGRATAYLCRDFTCSSPVTDADALVNLLKKKAAR